jgi:hypothetical protein
MVAVIAAIVQYAAPGTVSALQRDPNVLAEGQWWRLVTPLLVQTLGLHQVIANLLALAIVGSIAEWLLGRWRWVILFASGTLGGQVAAYTWYEPGGGSSIAICGLAGGVVASLLAGNIAVPRLTTHAVVYYIVALTGWGFNGLLAAGMGCMATFALLYSLNRIGMPSVERVALMGSIVCAAALTAVRDLHGISLMTGIVVGAIIMVPQVMPWQPRSD